MVSRRKPRAKNTESGYMSNQTGSEILLKFFPEKVGCSLLLSHLNATAEERNQTITLIWPLLGNSDSGERRKNGGSHVSRLP